MTTAEYRELLPCTILIMVHPGKQNLLQEFKTEEIQHKILVTKVTEAEKLNRKTVDNLDISLSRMLLTYLT